MSADVPPHRFPQPEWNDPTSVDTALEALRDAHDESSADEACDRLLWALGSNHEGTFYPVVLAVLPEIGPILQHGSAWSQRAAMEALIDLGGTFVPEDGHEVHGGVSVQQAVRAFIRAMRDVVAPLAAGDDARARSANELVELIDDLAD